MIGMAVCRRVSVPMIVMLGLAEDHRADDVDRQAQHGDDDGLLVADRLRGEDSLD
ncbi:MAG: hypothetical protein OZX49_02408 [Immundisolibacter sp.]|nr:hypothetical protein [Immundisolibacter sp.]